MKNFFKKIGRAVTGRRGIGTTLTVVIICAVVLFNVLAYTLTSAFGLYLYTEEKSDYSISGNVDIGYEEAVQVGKKVKITFCMPRATLENHDTGAPVLETVRQFEKMYPDLIEIHFVNMLTKLDEDMNIFDFDRYKESDDEELIIRTNSVIFECEWQNTFKKKIITDTSTSVGFVNFYTLDSDSNIIAYNGEEVVASMISWVITNKQHPTVYLTQNHGETADLAFYNMLVCAGYENIETINLRTGEIPSDAGMVIISLPTTDFQKSVEGSSNRGEIEKLRDYLERGGKLFVTIDPYSKELPNLEALLAEYGITISNVSNENGTSVRNIVKESTDAITTDGYTFVATHADSDIAKAIGDRISEFGSDRVLMSSVAKLETDASLGAYPLLTSGPSSETYASGQRTDASGNYAVSAYSKRDVGDGKEATVVVIPTAYMTATDAFVSEGYSNKNFLYASFEALLDAPTAPCGAKPVLQSTSILENLTMGMAKLYTAIIMLIPVALAVTGVVITIRRKNR